MTPEELHQKLLELRLVRETELQDQFNRSLPFADGLFDRWERAKRLGFGEKTSIYDSACVFGDVKVGDNTWIGPWVLLDGTAGLSIGSYCSVSAGVHIYSHDTVTWSLSGGKIPKRVGPVRIGDNVYIGSQAVIARKVTIGNMAVIAANSFVRQDVPARTIMSGVPARPIGRIEGDGEHVRLVIADPALRHEII